MRERARLLGGRVTIESRLRKGRRSARAYLLQRRVLDAPMIRVLLAEDHHLVRAGLRALLDPLPTSRSSARRATAARRWRCSRSTNADVAILDISMPG
jgi:hypothetical protein